MKKLLTTIVLIMIVKLISSQTTPLFPDVKTAFSKFDPYSSGIQNQLKDGGFNLTVSDYKSEMNEVKLVDGYLKTDKAIFLSYSSSLMDERYPYLSNKPHDECNIYFTISTSKDSDGSYWVIPIEMAYSRFENDVLTNTWKLYKINVATKSQSYFITKDVRPYSERPKDFTITEDQAISFLKKHIESGKCKAVADFTQIDNYAPFAAITTPKVGSLLLRTTVTGKLGVFNEDKSDMLNELENEFTIYVQIKNGKNGYEVEDDYIYKSTDDFISNAMKNEEFAKTYNVPYSTSGYTGVYKKQTPGVPAINNSDLLNSLKTAVDKFYNFVISKKENLSIEEVKSFVYTSSKEDIYFNDFTTSSPSYNTVKKYISGYNFNTARILKYKLRNGTSVTIALCDMSITKGEKILETKTKNMVLFKTDKKVWVDKEEDVTSSLIEEGNSIWIYVNNEWKIYDYSSCILKSSALKYDDGLK